MVLSQCLSVISHSSPGMPYYFYFASHWDMVKGRSVSFSDAARPQPPPPTLMSCYFGVLGPQELFSKTLCSEHPPPPPPPPSQNTHLNSRAIIIQNFPQLHTITVQCEIPPTQQINTQCKQCLCTHGPVCEGLRPRSISMFTGYCTCRIHNIHTIIQEHNDCIYLALSCLL